MQQMNVFLDVKALIQQQHIQPQVLPFLNNYKHEITDEEMYKLFNLTDKEIEYIKNF